MLFSEPKIPQCYLQVRVYPPGERFSALQRAENSSIPPTRHHRRHRYPSFSALQRAENSSIALPLPDSVALAEFQCSSASRKFLNRAAAPSTRAEPRFQCSSASRKFLNVTLDEFCELLKVSFSALQRAENSSIVVRREIEARRARFSALQRAENSSIRVRVETGAHRVVFQCSSASRKFLNG